MALVVITQLVFSGIVAVFTVATVLESRRQARLDQVNRRLEKLYTPVRSILQQMPHDQLLKGEDFEDSPWSRNIATRFEESGHLATEDLLIRFETISERLRPDDGTPRRLGQAWDQFSERVNRDFRDLQNEIRALTGRGGQIQTALAIAGDRLS